MTITYIVPLGPAPRSITGVEVMPISGATWLQPRLSLGDSPLGINDACHSTAPESESKAYTEPCSVATKTALKKLLPTPSFDRYSGCASTLPSTGKMRSNPKLGGVTLARVSVISD